MDLDVVSHVLATRSHHACERAADPLDAALGGERLRALRHGQRGDQIFYRPVGLILCGAMVRPVVRAGASHRLGRRPRMKAAERKTAIRVAALRIFRRQGYHAASMQEIADAVGLYKASLYCYVASKEELLVQLFEGRAEQVLAEVGAAASGPGTPRERLGAMVRAYVLGVLRNLDSVHVYLREEHALPPAALNQVHREQQGMRDPLRSRDHRGHASR